MGTIPWSDTGAATALASVQNERTARSRWLGRLAACIAALAPLAISAEASADHCAFFANDDYSGANVSYDIPNSGSHSGYSWGPTGVRRVGSHLNSPGNAIYNNLESPTCQRDLRQPPGQK